MKTPNQGQPQKNIASTDVATSSRAVTSSVPSLYEIMMHLRQSFQNLIHHRGRAGAKQNDAQILTGIRKKYPFAHEASKRILKISNLRHPHHHTYISRYRNLWIFSGEMLFRKAKQGTGGTLSLRVLRTFAVENPEQQYMIEKGRSAPTVAQAVSFSVDSRLRIVETFLVLQAFACTAVGWWKQCRTNQKVQDLFSLFLSPLDWTSSTFLQTHAQLDDESRCEAIKKTWIAVEKIIEDGTEQLIEKLGPKKRKVRLQDRPLYGEYAASLIQEEAVEVVVPSWTFQVVKHLCKLFAGNTSVKNDPLEKNICLDSLVHSALKCFHHFLENELGHIEDPDLERQKRDDQLLDELFEAILPSSPDPMDDRSKDVLDTGNKNGIRKNNGEQTNSVEVINIEDDDDEVERATTTTVVKTHSPMKRKLLEDSDDVPKEATPPHKKRKVVATHNISTDPRGDASRREDSNGDVSNGDVSRGDASRGDGTDGGPSKGDVSIVDAIRGDGTGGDGTGDAAADTAAQTDNDDAAANTAANTAPNTAADTTADTITATAADGSVNSPPDGKVGAREVTAGSGKDGAAKADAPDKPDESNAGDNTAAPRISAVVQNEARVSPAQAIDEPGHDEDFGGFDHQDSEFGHNGGHGAPPPSFPPPSQWHPKGVRSEVTRGLASSQLELMSEILLWDVPISGNHKTWIHRFCHSYRNEAKTAHERLYGATAGVNKNIVVDRRNNHNARIFELNAQVVDDYTILWRYLYVYEVRSALADEFAQLYSDEASYRYFTKYFYQAVDQDPEQRLPPFSVDIKKRLPSPGSDLGAFSCKLYSSNSKATRILKEAHGTFLCMCRFYQENGSKFVAFAVSSPEGSDERDPTLQKLTFSNKVLVDNRVLLDEKTTFELVFITSITQYLRTFAGVANVHLLPTPLQRDIISCEQTHAATSTFLVTGQIDPDSEACIDTQLRKGEIDVSQHKALKCVLERIGKLSEKRSSLTLIQGPPGTGKTRSVLALISALLSNSSVPALDPDPEDGILRRGNLKRTDVPRRTTFTSIAVLASSNVAVDLIMERIHRSGIQMPDGRVMHPQMIRIGKPNYKPGFVGAEQYLLSNKVRKYWQDHSPPSPGENAEAPQSRSFHYGMLAVANETILCFATVGACSSSSFTQLRKQYDVVIIDESSRTQDPELSAACMACHMSNLRTGDEIHCVLVGDHKQLGPVAKALQVFQSSSGSLRFQNDPMGHFESRLLALSTFERLQSSGRVPTSMLTIQYRMAPAISSIQSDLFYDGMVKNGLPASHFETPYLVRLCPVSWIDTSIIRVNQSNLDVFHNVIQGKGQLVNSYEIRVVSKVLENLKTFLRNVRNLPISEWPAISVVTPYRAQLRQFQAVKRGERDLFGNSVRFSYPKLKLSTVDAMQGSEDDIVIVSCVRAVRDENRPERGRRNRNSRHDSSSSRRRLGFLADTNRLNVLFSRAKYAHIVVGHSATLAGTEFEFWNRYYDYCRDRSNEFTSVEAPFASERGWSADPAWFLDPYRVRDFLKEERFSQ